MKFEEFVVDAVRIAGVRSQPPVTASHPLLNGVPYATFRREIDIDTRRELGAFFSSETMANALAHQLFGLIGDDALVLDPTCGIGDLLLARATVLPLQDTLAATLAAWGERLAGFDVQDDLVSLCKVRLCMLARARGEFVDEIDPLDAFPNILAQDMVAAASQDLFARADAILLNPPFGKTTWHTQLGWASGQINAAAIFLDHVVSSVRSDVPIAAVLPEVLRCGSRYERFRSRLADIGYSGSFEVHGRFDAWTDIDVFLTLLTRSGIAGDLWRCEEVETGATIEDHFEVRVGPVVPHRDAARGPWHAYICARTTPPWETGFVPTTHRRHTGSVFSPPFVVIRRTSSPSDKFRAVATVVAGDKPVAVENHLLVAKPHSGTLESCRDLVDVLRSAATNDRLNHIMRCRHLTVGVIRALPWAESCD